MRSLERIVALLPWCSSVSPSVCPSGTGVHCGHTVHASADLSLWLDSPMFWAPWHQSISTYSQPSLCSSTWKRSGVRICKLGVISHVVYTKTSIIRIAHYLCGSWSSCSIMWDYLIMCQVLVCVLASEKRIHCFVLICMQSDDKLDRIRAGKDSPDTSGTGGQRRNVIFAGDHQWHDVEQVPAGPVWKDFGWRLSRGYCPKIRQYLSLISSMPWLHVK